MWNILTVKPGHRNVFVALCGMALMAYQSYLAGVGVTEMGNTIISDGFAIAGIIAGRALNKRWENGAPQGGK